jgi:hypothetical protein
MVKSDKVISEEHEFFRLLQIRGMLKLEKVGLTHSSGLRIRPRVAKEFGLKPRDSYDKYIAAVQLKIDEHIDKKRSI